MTRHDEPAQPDEDDLGSEPDRDPLPALSAGDDAFVSGLLAGLPGAAMPDAVAARISSALAELPPADAPAEPLVSTTVVPFTAHARAAARWRNPRAFQVAAVAVLVIAGGIVGIKTFAGQSTGASTATAGSLAPQAKTTITRSNRAYTSANLVAGVHSLVPGARSPGNPQAAGSTGAPSTGTPSPPGTLSTPTTPGVASATSGYSSAAAVPRVATTALDPALRALTSSTKALAPCIAAIEDGLLAYVDPIAIDAGTYDGKSALVVILPGSDDPTAYDVWIVGPTCGTNKDAALIRYQSVPRG